MTDPNTRDGRGDELTDQELEAVAGGMPTVGVPSGPISPGPIDTSPSPGPIPIPYPDTGDTDTGGGKTKGTGKKKIVILGRP